MTERLQVFAPGDALAISAAAAARIASAGGRFSREELQVAFPKTKFAATQLRAGGGAASGAAPAIVSITGLILHGTDLWGFGTDVAEVRRQVKALAAAKAVSAVVLYVDSPGGTVTGIQEGFDAIAAAARVKPVLASIAGLGASAAYWLAAGAPYISMSKSAEAASIGVFAAHVDLSGQLQQEGVAMTLISSTPEKVEGNPYQPLSNAARATLTKTVDFYAAMFENAVAQGRGVSPAVVRDRFGRGRLLQSPEALFRGVVDAIGTFEDVMAMAQAPAKIRAAIEAPGRARAELLRAELELEYLRLGLEPPKNLGAPGPTPAESREIETARLLLGT